MNIPRLICLIAESGTAGLYRPDALDEGDRLRVQANPALERRTDWQVSRFLKQQAAQAGLPSKSLSHSKGAAAVLCGTAALRAGVDIEYMRPRDFAALAGWTATASEQEILAANGWRAEDFYRLWTLKEALLKAAGLAFPADMPNVGLAVSDGLLRLHAAGSGNWHGISAVAGGKWMLSCVWQGQAETVFRPFGNLVCRPAESAL